MESLKTLKETNQAKYEEIRQFYYSKWLRDTKAKYWHSYTAYQYNFGKSWARVGRKTKFWWNAPKEYMTTYFQWESKVIKKYWIQGMLKKDKNKEDKPYYKTKGFEVANYYS